MEIAEERRGILGVSIDIIWVCRGQDKGGAMTTTRDDVSH